MPRTQASPLKTGRGTADYRRVKGRSIHPLVLVRTAALVVMAAVWLFVLGKVDPTVAAGVGALIVIGVVLLARLPQMKVLSTAQLVGLQATFWFSLLALPLAYFLSQLIGPLGPVALMIGVGSAGAVWWKFNVAEQQKCQKLRKKAEALLKQGEFTQAEDLLKKALNRAMQLKANRVDTLSRAFQDLANLYCQMARWTEAEEYCLRAISAMEEPGTAAQRLLPGTLELLASIYAHQRNFTSFDLALEKSAELFSHLHGEAAPETAAKLLEFAHRAESENRAKTAVRFYQACIAKLQDALGHHAEPVGQVHFRLGSYLERSDRLDEAILSYRTTLQVNEKVFGPEDPKVVPALEALASVHMKQGSSGKARDFLERAVRIREEELGGASPVVAALLIPLAECALATGEVAFAEEVAAKAVAILEATEDPLLPRALAISARIKVAEGQPKAAEGLFSNAIRLLQEAVGATHPEIARYLDGRAEAVELLGEAEEAERLRSRASEIRHACLA